MRVLLKNSGFTIIEIIIAIAIITILLALSYSGYATFSTRQKLISSGQNLKNLLRDVQSRTFNNEVDCSVCTCNSPTINSLDAWVVDLQNRVFYGKCQNNTFLSTALNIQADITISSDNTKVEFLSSPPRASDDVGICLSTAGLSNSFYRIDVSRSGDISDSEGLISTCTP